MVTDASGNILGENRYYPYGETRLTTGTIYTDKLFTGQREIAGLGLYHYGARFYSPKLGRFLSADSIVPGYANPQNLNRFSYVTNNPLRYTDPTGHMEEDDDDGGCYLCGGGGGGSGGGDGEEDDEVVMGPPEPDYDLSSLRGVPSNITLHPSDIILGGKHTVVGYVPVYSDGVLIGYEAVYYSPDYSTADWNWDANGTTHTWGFAIAEGGLETLKYLGKKMLTKAGAKTLISVIGKSQWAIAIYTTADRVNDSVIVKGNLRIGGGGFPFVPLTESPSFDFGDLTNPFNPALWDLP